MTKKTKSLQILVIASAIVLFAALYFGFDTKAPEQDTVEKSRALAITTTDFPTILKLAKETAGDANLLRITPLEIQLEKASPDSAKVNTLKLLSGEWFRMGYPEVAGHYANLVAEIEGTAEAWSIAGTTFNYSLQSDKSERVLAFSFEQAVTAFENAVSLDPQNSDHQINLALTYIAKPPQENPMKGILMLRNLQEKDPSNARVLFQLGRLAISTGQFEKAIERLEQAQTLEPSDIQTVCLLADAYSKAGKTDLAEKQNARCRELSR